MQQQEEWVLGNEKVMLNIEKYGNTTNGTIPLCLWEWEKQLKKGDNLILAAFGGGFTWGSIYLKWAMIQINNYFCTVKKITMKKMDLKDIQELIKFVAKSGATDVELEIDNIKISIKSPLKRRRGRLREDLLKLFNKYPNDSE